MAARMVWYGMVCYCRTRWRYSCRTCDLLCTIITYTASNCADNRLCDLTNTTNVNAALSLHQGSHSTSKIKFPNSLTQNFDLKMHVWERGAYYYTCNKFSKNYWNVITERCNSRLRTRTSQRTHHRPHTSKIVFPSRLPQSCVTCSYAGPIASVLERFYNIYSTTTS